MSKQTNKGLEQFITNLENILEEVGYEIASGVQVFESDIEGFILQKESGFYDFSREINSISNLGKLLPVEIEILEKEGLIEKKK